MSSAIPQALVIGFGRSGRSAASFLKHLGWKVVAIDKNCDALRDDPEVKILLHMGLNLFDERILKNFSLFELAILSPGISPLNPIVQEVKNAGVEVIGEIELALRYLSNPILGITGTNGKTTVTLFATHVLNYAAKKARALGNVGVPLAEQIPTLASDEIIVLELSSFQIETLAQKKLEAAAILNITEDHLDRYRSFEEYAKAKMAIENCLVDQAPLYIEEQIYKNFPSYCTGASIYMYGYDPSLPFSTDLKSIFRKGKKVMQLPESLMGKKSHDLENFIAAFALLEKWEIAPKIFIEAFNTFKKPPHRIEFVKSIQGIYFYDDSKGTNVDAVVRAVERMEGETFLIAGGVDKGAPYLPWIEAFQGKVKKIFALGEASSKIKADVSWAIPVEICKDMKQAVQRAFTSAKEGNNILLSPGCSSFDMFRDYADRGREFQRCVHSLEEDEFLTNGEKKSFDIS